MSQGHKLEIVGDELLFGGVVVATMKSEHEVPATIMEGFRQRLGERPGNYHPQGFYDNPANKLRTKR